eukprot:m.106331 g.106331  ORF g.106331 m.106331 type:complete len:249 (-) comp22536_c0_seq2:234-980(-)
MKYIFATALLLCAFAAVDAQFAQVVNNTECRECAFEFSRCMDSATSNLTEIACFEAAFVCLTNNTGCAIPLPTTTTVEPTTTESCDHVMNDCFDDCNSVRKRKKRTKCQLKCAFPPDGDLPEFCGACVASSNFETCILFCGRIVTCGDPVTTTIFTTTGAPETTADETTAADTTAEAVTGTEADETTAADGTTAADEGTPADDEDATTGAPAAPVCPAYRPCRCKPNAFAVTLFNSDGCPYCRCKRSN